MDQRLAERARSSNREDDSPERIKKRIESFKGSNMEPLLQQLSKNPIYKACTKVMGSQYNHANNP
jgi:hypothetical protein